MDEVPASLDGPSLAKRLGISTRTLYAWGQARLIPRPPPHGHLTRYDRAAIIIAHAVAALRRDGVPLAHVGRFLAKKSEHELREIGGLPAAPPPAPPPALPAGAAPPAALPANASASTVTGPTVSSPAAAASPTVHAQERAEPAASEESSLVSGSVVPSESLAVQDRLAHDEAADDEADHDERGRGIPVGAEWRRIELLPGLELHVRADASPFVHGLAAAIASGRFTK